MFVSLLDNFRKPVCSVSNFKTLQRVQNTLARVVLQRGKFEHITPALIDLHWLPVQ